MSEKLSEMYKLDRTIGLVTIASPVIQNLALLDVDEYLIADSLAVIHMGYINYIPIINSMRRSKYISIQTGIDRGKGCIFIIKWIKISSETFFVVLSTEGLNIYDAEITEDLYHFKFKNTKDLKDVIPIGAAAVGQHLCVGTNEGFVYIFQDNGAHNFELVHRVQLGDYILLDGISHQLVACSRQTVNIWDFKNCFFHNQKTLSSAKNKAVPGVLKVVPELALVGYENGELDIYSTERYKSLIRLSAHKAKITTIDYSHLKNMILTGSLDKQVKVWQLNFTHSSLSSIFCLETNHEVCGVGFLNLRCTEFCVVKSNNISIDVFVKVESEYD